MKHFLTKAAEKKGYANSFALTKYDPRARLDTEMVVEQGQKTRISCVIRAYELGSANPIQRGWPSALKICIEKTLKTIHGRN
jgi:hypothetical protein